MTEQVTLPRELAPGLWWLGRCSRLEFSGRIIHSYNSAYLVSGSEASLLVEAGAPFDLPVLEGQLDDVLARGVAPLRYVFPTHSETNHSSGLGRILDRFDDAVIVGDYADLHLNFPNLLDRVADRPPQEPIDLGGRDFMWTPAVFRDLRSTRWGFDSGSRALFTSDGVAYSHYHLAGHCGRTAEEAIECSSSLDMYEMTKLFAEGAFYWTRFVDIEPYVARIDELIAKLDVALIAPTHGLPITDIDATLEYVREGLRASMESTVNAIG